MSAWADRDGPLVMAEVREYVLGARDGLFILTGDRFPVIRNGVVDSSTRCHWKCGPHRDWHVTLQH